MLTPKQMLIEALITNPLKFVKKKIQAIRDYWEYWQNQIGL